MYDASIPVFLQYLGALSRILKKAEAHCEAKKIDPAVMLSQRLYPDMFALTRQVQVACDVAKGAGCRLSGTAIPSFPDEEKTFAELQARIAKTVDFLKSLDKKAFDDAATRDITFKAGSRDVAFKGADYLGKWGFPNFFFHLTAAYGILRHNGVELGKSDYLAP
jgi:uncharacterized protein